MAATEISVDINRIDRMTEIMADSVSEIKSTMHLLIEGMECLDNMWDGIASMAFFRQFENDCQMLLEFCDDLQMFCECNDEASKRYLENERKLNEAVRGFNIFVF